MLTKTSTSIFLLKQCQANLRRIGLFAGGTILGLSFNLLASLEAKAASFNFTKIADSSSSLDVFGGFSLNNKGTVAFEASLDGGGEGIFTGNGMNVTSIAQTNDYFQRFRSSPDINDSGTVAFDAVLKTGVTGVFTGNGSTTTPIDIGNPGIPNPTFSRAAFAPSINNAGMVAYVITAFRDAGIGGAPVVGGGFRSYYDPYINDRGVVAYGVIGLFVEGGIQTSDGSVTLNFGAQPIRAIPFYSFSFNNAGTLAFVGLNNAQPQYQTGIYKTNGTVITTVAEGNGLSYLNPSINNNGSVAFLARNLAGGKQGIFTGADSLTDQVIATGDSLFGSTVTQLSFSRKGFNDAGQVAFFAKFADGTSGIFRADPVSTPKSVPEPSSGWAVLILGTLGLGAVVKRQYKKSQLS